MNRFKPGDLLECVIDDEELILIKSVDVSNESYYRVFSFRNNDCFETCYHHTTLFRHFKKIGKKIT